MMSSETSYPSVKGRMVVRRKTKERGEVDVLGMCRKVTNKVNALLARQARVMRLNSISTG